MRTKKFDQVGLVSKLFHVQRDWNARFAPERAKCRGVIRSAPRGSVMAHVKSTGSIATDIRFHRPPARDTVTRSVKGVFELMLGAIEIGAMRDD